MEIERFALERFKFIREKLLLHKLKETNTSLLLWMCSTFEENVLCDEELLKELSEEDEKNI